MIPEQLTDWVYRRILKYKEKYKRDEYGQVIVSESTLSSAWANYSISFPPLKDFLSKYVKGGK